MKRGKLAQATGCNLETIRYYEKIKLLPAPYRTQSGHRLYSGDDQKRLKFILRGRELGFSIHDLRDLLKLVDSEDYTAGEVLEITAQHLTNVKAKIFDLKKIEKTLSDMCTKCAGGEARECTIIGALFDE